MMIKKKSYLFKIIFIFIKIKTYLSIKKWRLLTNLIIIKLYKKFTQYFQKCDICHRNVYIKIVN